MGELTFDIPQAREGGFYPHALEKGLRREAAEDIHTIFNAPDREMAEILLKKAVDKYARLVPKLADWMEVNLPEGFTVFSFPKMHQRRLRTSNLLERLSQEIKCGTRMVRVFPNEQSCLRLISSILMEVGEDWEYGRWYLQMDSGWNGLEEMKGFVINFTEKVLRNHLPGITILIWTL